MTPATPAIEIRDVSKTFRTQDGPLPWKKRSKAALQGVSVRVERGTVLAVLGANGSGKSSLVRILSTLLQPDTGSAQVFGHDVMREPGKVRERINRVSVEAAFFKEMSAWENMLYAARLYGTASGLRPRVEEI